MHKELEFSYPVAEEVAKRLGEILGNLPIDNAKCAFEELIDDYCYAEFGVSVLAELRKVQVKDSSCTTIQTLAKGRAVVISSYGFTVKADSECSCGMSFLTLHECAKNSEKE